MDSWASLLATLKAAENTLCEHGGYAGFTVGQVWREWPEEILSGKVQKASSARSGSSKVIRAFTKLAQAAAELQSAVPLPTLEPTITMNSGNSFEMRPKSTNSRTREAPERTAFLEKFALVPKAATEPELLADEKPRSRKAFAKSTKSTATQTGEEAVDGGTRLQRAWAKARRFVKRPAPVVIGSLAALLLPKLVFMLLRIVAEFVIGQFISHVYSTTVTFAGEAGSFAENMVSQFENWMIYGQRRQSMPAATALHTAPLKAQLKSWASFVNVSEEEMCEAVDSLSPSILTQSPTFEPTVTPGIFSLAVIAAAAKVWTKI